MAKFNFPFIKMYVDDEFDVPLVALNSARVRMPQMRKIREPMFFHIYRRDDGTYRCRRFQPTPLQMEAALKGPRLKRIPGSNCYSKDAMQFEIIRGPKYAPVDGAVNPDDYVGPPVAEPPTDADIDFS